MASYEITRFDGFGLYTKEIIVINGPLSFWLSTCGYENQILKIERVAESLIG